MCVAGVAVKSIACFVPGRVCLLGEHSDWAGGMQASPYNNNNNNNNNDINNNKNNNDININMPPPGRCLAYGTPCGLHTQATLRIIEREEEIVKEIIKELGEETALFYMSSIQPDGTFTETRSVLKWSETKEKAIYGGFFSYVYGTITILLERYEKEMKEAVQKIVENRGNKHYQRLIISIENNTDLPIQKGLSSSAAVCVTIVRCFSLLFNLKLTIEEEMDIAFSGEILTGSECGRLDQCVAFGQGCCIDLHFRGSKVLANSIKLNPETVFYFIIADLNAKKDTKKILRELGSCFIGDEHDSIKKGVREFLGNISFSLVAKAEEAMRKGDAEKLGETFNEYQNLFDKYLMPACTELQAPRLHEVLNDKRVRELSCGGKGVGSQGDGSVQLICRNENDQLELLRILEENLNCHPIPLSLKGSC